MMDGQTGNGETGKRLDEWVGELFAPVPGAVFAFFGLKAYSSKRNNAFRWLHTVKRFEQPLQNVDCGASSS